MQSVAVSGGSAVNLTDRTTNYSYGPQVGLSPITEVLLMRGYNFNGCRDANSRLGVFASVKMKLDAKSFGYLGLGQ